ncbi:MAG TPA: hypothetical protein VK470_09790, partial [Bacteroidota bacterium]|nr:hypothetical protein [Bacteroidota bacterium]
MRSIIISLFLLICAGVARAQTNLEILVDSSASLTQLTKHMGHGVKFLATDTRLVALDYENSRIVLYARGSDFTNNTWIATIGEHSLPRNN